MKYRLFSILLFWGLGISATDSSYASDDIQLSWEAVTQDTLNGQETTPLYYAIYCQTFPYFTPDSGNFLAATRDTSFIHQDSRIGTPDYDFYYIVRAVDAWGNPSGYAQSIGPKDYVLSRAKVFIRGAADTSATHMSTALRDSGYVPTDSPFATAPRRVGSVPDDIVDWVRVDLLEAALDTAVASESFFLRSDGYLVEPDGQTAILGIPAIADGEYYLRIKPRNHVAALSKITLSLDKTLPATFDFTLSRENYYDPSVALNIHQKGVWGTRAGDLNDDELVNFVDYSEWKAAVESAVAGYQNADLDFDGMVTTRDYQMWYNSYRLNP